MCSKLRVMLDLPRYWYRESLHPLTLALLPFSWLFAAVTALRRLAYRSGLFKTQRFPVPVIIVGNLTVGGTGKTPFVIWLSALLQSQGYRPGIVSRGVGGKKHLTPYRVQAQDVAKDVGDEAVLLAKHSGCPVMIGINRADAVRELLASTNCNVVISDDGLQHYRLKRDIEIAVIDGLRRFGNGCLLPAGPLRESPARKVDFTVVNGGDEEDAYTLSLQPSQLVALQDKQQKMLADFPHKKIHAVAAIGHPERFFISLRRAGFELITHVFPDHHLYQASDFHFTDSLPIVMTEKDAVKCGAFADARFWYLDINVKMNANFTQQFLKKLTSLEVCHDSEADFSKRACHAVNHEHNDSTRR